MEHGRFRADLFHRLAVYPIHVPPLRDRRDDIPLLAAHFLDDCRQRLGLGPLRLSDSALERLTIADWPGNVRELENVISRGVLRATHGAADRSRMVLIEPQHLDLQDVRQVGTASPLRKTGKTLEPAVSLAERLDAFRRRTIVETVERHDGNWAAAARELGLHRSNLHQLATRLGLRSRRNEATLNNISTD
jgi:anaerobic nitric oxide reductase transcription regulator